MFKLFKKKEEPVKAQEDSVQKSPEMQAFAAQFDTREQTILAVTGSSGFGGGKLPDGQLWRAGIWLSAWMDEDELEIHQERVQLETLADQRLLSYLIQRVPRDFIIKVKVRPALDGQRFFMVELPQPAFDPDLKAILEQQKKPRVLEDEVLGQFVLNRSAGWFEQEADWLDQDIQLTFDPGEEEQKSLDTARTLMAGQEDWDARIRSFAAQQLAHLAKDWDGEEEEPIDQEQFIQRLEPESLQVGPDGSFHFWFQDAQMLWSHGIRVSGTVEQGPLEARTED